MFQQAVPSYKLKSLQQKKPKTAWGKIFGKGTVNTRTTLTPDDEINKKVEQYKYIPKPDIDSSPLVWWKLHHGQFPLMQKLARKYLCCCATSVSSERGSSVLGAELLMAGFV